MCEYIYIYIYTLSLFAKSAGAVEYTSDDGAFRNTKPHFIAIAPRSTQARNGST